MSRIFTTLTFAQFYRAFLLAQHHGHGWAEELNRCGVRAHSEPRIGIRTEAGPEELAELAEKMENANAEQVNAWDLIRRSIQERTDIADQDLETFALTGSESWPPALRAGIWNPGVSDTGKSYHTTRTGRLSWTIDREGRVEIEICRPGQPLFSVGVWVACAPTLAARLQEALDLACSPENRTGSRTSSEANVLRDQIAGALAAQGFKSLYGEQVEIASNLPGDVVLSIESAENDSIVVLQAYVSADGHAVVHQLRAGALLYLRHVATLEQALGAMGVQWDPQVELP